MEAAEATQGIPEVAVPDLAGHVLAVVVVLGLVLVWTLVVPALFLLVGVLVGVAALIARLLSLQAWRIEAHGRRTRLVWWVRGPLESRRAMRSVARALAQGDEPRVGGRAPDGVLPAGTE